MITLMTTIIATITTTASKLAIISATLVYWEYIKKEYVTEDAVRLILIYV